MQVKEEITINHKRFDEKENKTIIKSFKVDKSCLNKSNVLLNLIKDSEINIDISTDEALLFVINYLLFYKDVHEYPQPEYPLQESSLEEVFENEKLIFGELLILEKDKQNEKTNYIINLIKLTKFLDLHILYDKLCAILSVYIKNLNQQFPSI